MVFCYDSLSKLVQWQLLPFMSQKILIGSQKVSDNKAAKFGDDITVDSLEAFATRT